MSLFLFKNSWWKFIFLDDNWFAVSDIGNSDVFTLIYVVYLLSLNIGLGKVLVSSLHVGSSIDLFWWLSYVGSSIGGSCSLVLRLWNYLGSSIWRNLWLIILRSILRSNILCGCIFSGLSNSLISGGLIC